MAATAEPRAVRAGGARYDSPGSDNGRHRLVSGEDDRGARGCQWLSLDGNGWQLKLSLPSWTQCG